MTSDDRYDWLKLSAAWGAFVFIPFNLYAGALLSESHSASNAILGLVIGSFILLSLTAPAVIYASATGRNYSESIDHEVTSTKIAYLLKLLVPLVNIGWFAIQTVAFTNILFPDGSNYYVFIYCLAAAALFVMGPLRWGYSWLYRSGLIALLAMFAFMAGIIITGNDTSQTYEMPNITGVIENSLLVIGTWIFSSTTCVMDIARNCRKPPLAVSAVLFGTIAADIGLLLLGFLYADSATKLLIQTNTFNIISIFLMIALWSTNDSNYYSTEQSMQRLGFTPKFTSALVILSTACMGAFFGNNLFSYFGTWLQVMGWIGIPMGLFWFFRIKHVLPSY